MRNNRNIRSRSNAVITNQTGFDWDIIRKTPYVQSESGIFVPENDFVILKRSDNGRTLHNTNATYTETSNKQFVEYTQRLSEASGFEIEGYSEFRQGEKVLSYLKQTDDFIHQYLGLQAESYLVFGNSHNGTTPLFVGSANMLLRCHNQWGSVSKGLKIKHTSSWAARMQDFIQLVALFKANKMIEAQRLAQLREIEIDHKILEALANRLLGLDEKIGSGEDLGKVKRDAQSALMQSMVKETNELGMNLFGFWNGATHYTTHDAKKQGNEDVWGNMLGVNATFNEKALNIATNFATTDRGLVLAS